MRQSNQSHNQSHLMRRASYLFPVLLLVVATALWITNCSGPRPVASDPRVEAPTTPGKPYHVTARVHNDGPGHGQVRVVFQLREIHTGRVYQQTEEVTLQSDETVVVGVDISAPPGDYRPEVSVNYPP